MVADFWFTCWVDAGQPDLMAPDTVETDSIRSLILEDKSKWLNIKIKGRSHEN